MVHAKSWHLTIYLRLIVCILTVHENFCRRHFSLFIIGAQCIVNFRLKLLPMLSQGLAFLSLHSMLAIIECLWVVLDMHIRQASKIKSLWLREIHSENIGTNRDDTLPITKFWFCQTYILHNILQQFLALLASLLHAAHKTIGLIKAIQSFLVVLCSIGFLGLLPEFRCFLDSLGIVLRLLSSFYHI